MHLLLYPQTTNEIRDPKFLPEFDMAVLQRSGLHNSFKLLIRILVFHYVVPVMPYNMRFWQMVQLNKGKALATLKKDVTTT